MSRTLLTSLFTMFVVSAFVSWSNAVAVDYFFDQYRGADDNEGTRERPFKELQKIHDLPLKPGDRVCFVRGSSYHGSVTIEASGTQEAPIVLTSYGEGHLPKFTNSDFDDAYGSVFRIKGSHVVVDGLYFHSGPSVPPTREGSDAVRKTGAVFVERGAENVVIRNCEVVDYPIGFQIYGERCLITRNYLHDCQAWLKHPNWGPIGIMVATSHNEISYNRIENYICSGGAYGADGGAIEIDFADIPKRDIEVHHNWSVGNCGFLEVYAGVCDIRDIRVHHNVSEDYQQFVFFWNGIDCLVDHNTVLCLRPRIADGVQTDSRTVFVLRRGKVKNITVRNNIFLVADGLQVFGLGGTHRWPQDFDQPRSHNLYFCIDGTQDDPCGKPLAEGEMTADPRFVDLDRMDLRLRPDSPAIDAAKNLGYMQDYAGNMIPQGKAPDIGAYEAPNEQFKLRTPDHDSR